MIFNQIKYKWQNSNIEITVKILLCMAGDSSRYFWCMSEKTTEKIFWFWTKSIIPTFIYLIYFLWWTDISENLTDRMPTNYYKWKVINLRFTIRTNLHLLNP